MLLYHDAWIHFHWTDDNIGSLRHTVKCSHEQRQSGMTSHNYTPQSYTHDTIPYCDSEGDRLTYWF